MCSTGQEYSSSVWSYDGNIWVPTAESAAWSPRNGFGLVVFANRLWILGGHSEDGLQADVWSSDDGASWDLVNSAASFGPRRSFGAVTFLDRLFLLGGQNGSGRLSDVWSSSNGDVWELVTSNASWNARQDFGVAIFDGSVWVLGGHDGQIEPLQDVWSSQDGAAWAQVQPSALWGPRFGLAAITFASRLWVFGGYKYLPRRSFRPRPYKRHWSPGGSVLEVPYPSWRLALADVSLAGGSGLPVEVSAVRPASLAAARGVKAGDRLFSVDAHGLPLDLGGPGGFTSRPAGDLSSLPVGPLVLGFTDPRSTDPSLVIVPQQWYVDYAETYTVDIWSTADGVDWRPESQHTWAGPRECRGAFAALLAEAGPYGLERRLVVLGASGEHLYRSAALPAHQEEGAA